MCDHDCGGMHSERVGNGLNARPCVNGANTAPRKAVGRGLLAGSAAFAAMGIGLTAHGATRTFYVDASRPAGGDGLSWATAFNDLQIALDRTQTLTLSEVQRTEIVFRVAQGTYRPTEYRQIAFKCTGAVTSAARVTIAGSFGGYQSATPDARDFVMTQTILSADVNGDDGPDFTNRSDNCDTVFGACGYDWVFPVTKNFRLSGLVLQGGHSLTLRPSAFFMADHYYSGYSYAINYSFDNCTIRDNYGSAVASLWYDENIINAHFETCSFTGNFTTDDGAAMNFRPNQFAYIRNSKFTRNRATNGGAIASDAYVSIAFCTFADNAAIVDGGAINQTSDLWYGSNMASCLFTNNVASVRGGGMAADLVHIDNCTFVHNIARWGGGAFLDGDSFLNDSIVSLNSAMYGGSQLAGGGEMPEMSRVATDGGLDGVLFPFSVAQPRVGYELFSSAAEFVDALGPDNDARTWIDNNYRLVPRSPLLDVFLIESTVALDLDGNSRTVEGVIGRGPRVDLGCYESQLTLCPTDINADGGITIDDLLDFLVAFEAGLPLADLTSNGTTPFPDGGVTVDDLLFFLAKFEQGC